MEFIGAIMKIGYDFFQLESPWFGLTFWEISIGVLFASFSIYIAKSFITRGIGLKASWGEKKYD